jgi:pyridoxal/pyridoxine/pyridoxamine kinase
LPNAFELEQLTGRSIDDVQSGLTAADHLHDFDFAPDGFSPAANLFPGPVVL